MKSLTRKLITEWRRRGLPTSGLGVIIACSGGADSTALLFALKELFDTKKLTISLTAAHFDHGIRKESGRDAEFVRNTCEARGVEYVSGRAKLPKSGNLEENARNARYAFLAKIADERGSSFVLTGHTIDDQAETFLMNLIRGSGIEGLSAMPFARRLEGSRADLVRPMLHIATREDTVAFCRNAGLDFLNDPMNEDPRFTRVRVRKEIIPLLSELNPRIVQTLARTAEQIAAVRPTPLAPKEKLRSAEILAMEKEERFSAIRDWLVTQRGNARKLTFAHISAVSDLVESRKSGRIAELPDGAQVVRSGGWLTYRANLVEKGDAGA